MSRTGVQDTPLRETDIYNVPALFLMHLIDSNQDWCRTVQKVQLLNSLYNWSCCIPEPSSFYGYANGYQERNIDFICTHMHLDIAQLGRIYKHYAM